MNSLDNDRNLVRDDFVEHFAHLGYIPVPSVPVTRGDSTAHFVVATITPFMSGLLSQTLTPPGSFIVQKCLRTQNVDLSKTAPPPEYMTTFEMCGTISPSDCAPAVARQSLDLLRDKYGIKQSDLRVRASSADIGLYEGLKHQGVSVETDSRPESYYRWGYGRDGVSGRGITWAIRSSERLEFRDIGNVVMIRHNNVDTAVEFGFGIETLVSRMRGLVRPLTAAKISEVIPFTEGDMEKLADLLATSATMIHEGVVPGKNGQGKELKKHLRALSFWTKTLKIESSQVCDWVKQYCLLEFGLDSGVSQTLNKLMNRYQQLEPIGDNQFANYAANQVRAWQLRDVCNDQIFKILLRKASLPPFEVHQSEATQIIQNLLN